MNDTRQPKPKRRWYQFRLRTLFGVFVVLTLPLSWFGVRLHQARRQRAAAEVVWRLGGAVAYDFDYADTVYHNRSERRSEPTWLRRLLGDDFFSDVKEVVLSATPLPRRASRPLGEPSPHLYGLDLAESQITGAGLVHVKGLTELEWLDLHRTQITGAGLVHLEGLTKLETLHLNNTRVTGDGLVHLKGLAKLEALDLTGTQVADAGLEHLKELTHLSYLYLDGTNITDAGLEHLKGLGELRLLGLARTKVTDEGVTKLRKALPDCYIYGGLP